MAPRRRSHQRRPHIHLHTNDGKLVRVRRLRPTDGRLLAAMFWHLSPETRWRRFFVPLENLDRAYVRKMAYRLARTPAEGAALIATIYEHGNEMAVAVARYAQIEAHANAVEASLVVRDDFQHRGLGGQLFDLLVQTALAAGVQHFVLLTHADNSGMLTLLQRSGLPYSGHYASGLYEADLQLVDGQPPLFPYS